MLQAYAVLDKQESQLKETVLTIVKATRSVYSFEPSRLSSIVSRWTEKARNFEEGARFTEAAAQQARGAACAFSPFRRAVIHRSAKPVKRAALTDA